MRLIFSSIFICFLILKVSAQNSEFQAQWQQRSDHFIEVEFDSASKTLKGKMKWIYHNNSPNDLSKIMLHLWPNAYLNNKTAYARQLKRINETDFLVSAQKARGGIKAEFRQTGNVLKLTKDTLNPDIAELLLKTLLKSGDSIVLDVDFEVQLPQLFSRSGYKKNFIAACQWYPKPAVYDVNGWNPMPYLELGEFYSEFGNYDVNITVPSSFKVAATGTQTETKAEGNKRSYRFKEKNIHDFAWFASPDFKVAEQRFQPLKGGDSVTISIYADTMKDWRSMESIISYVEKTLSLYSEEIGVYPYSTCKVVLGSLEVGYGMEYPGITVCGEDMPEIVSHEVGHNWFYGILASNERKYPWMDESTNSYFDHLFSEIISHKKNDAIPDPSFYRRGVFGMLGNHPAYFNLKLLQGLNDLQPLNLESDEYTSVNYGNTLYGKGPMVFAYLREVLGDKVFTSCFRNYYNEWKFRHPLPGDIQASFEKTSAMKLDWFFKDILGDRGSIDVFSENGKYKIKGSRQLDSLWQARGGNPNPYGSLFEYNYRNNGQTKKLLNLSFIIGYQRLDRRINTVLTPVLGYNYYDKLYPGICLSNWMYNQSAFRYVLMPVYSAVNKQWAGYGKLSYSVSRKEGKMKHLTIGLEGQSFGTLADAYMNQYYKLNPYIRIDFKSPAGAPDRERKYLQLDFYHTGLKNKRYVLRDTLNQPYEVNHSRKYFMNYLRLTYSYDNHAKYSRWSYSLNAEHAYNYRLSPAVQSYNKLWAEAGLRQMYANKKYFRSAFYFGAMTNVKGVNEFQNFYMSRNGGQLDYLYNEYNLGRAENALSNNVLKNYFNGPGLRTNWYSQGSAKWMMTLKNDVDLPGFLPFRIYFDVGTYAYTNTIHTVNGIIEEEVKPALYYTAGIEAHLLKNTLEIFIPFIHSKQFIKPLDSAFLSALGFRLNLNQLSPEKNFTEGNLYEKLIE